MKAILEYDLPTESVEHNLALNGPKYYAVIESTLNLIRQKLKYDEITPDQEKVLEEIRDFINEELS